VIDVYGFKKVNDRWGHLYGDKVLVRLVGTLTRNLRASDMLFRTGGDEFAILALETSPREATGLAVRLAGAIRKAFVEEGLSISWGVAAALEDGQALSPQEMYLLADRRFYDKKAKISVPREVQT